MAQRAMGTALGGRVFRSRDGRGALAAGVLAGAMVGLAACQSGPREDPNAPLVWVEMDTTMGAITLELDREHAPVSVNNFLRYVDEGAYDGTIFHRVMKEFVIQGGGMTPGLEELPGHEPIVNEWMNGLKNTRGTIGMARNAEPDTADRQWYINVADNPKLDTARPNTGNAGYAVFGRVVGGMDVVDAIRGLAVTSREAQTLDPGGAVDAEGNPVRRAEMLENVPVDPPVVTGVRRVERPGV